MAVAVLGRILPHPQNFTPMLAVGLMAGMMYKSGWTSSIVILTCTIVSDILLSTYNSEVMAWSYSPFVQCVVYLTLIASAFMGKLIQPKQMGKTCLVALTGSILFFLTTNWACWVNGSMFPHTFGGMMENYAFALPFFGNTLVGDQFWTLLLVGVYSYCPTALRQPHLTWDSMKMQPTM